MVVLVFKDLQGLNAKEDGERQILYDLTYMWDLKITN